MVSPNAKSSPPAHPGTVVEVEVVELDDVLEVLVLVLVVEPPVPPEPPPPLALVSPPPQPERSTIAEARTEPARALMKPPLPRSHKAKRDEATMSFAAIVPRRDSLDRKGQHHPAAWLTVIPAVARPSDACRQPPFPVRGAAIPERRPQPPM
jgi:hypothetical protein